ncbi:MAG: glycosyltransferase, partial [Chitinivibrionales bacterium]|nr:glycosyltransferase [Chitinivibrionales bacterium]
VRNEEAVLPRCLESTADIADEIIIVDTGSHDNTIAVAEQFNARIIQSEWKNDFSHARNISIEHASGEWILWLDADDVIPSGSIAPIRNLKQETADTVFAFIIQNRKPGGTGSSFMQARMFPNHPKIRFERKIHEQIMLSALRIGMKMINKDIVIEHYGYADPEQVRKKSRRNINALLEEFDREKPDAVMAVEIADAYTIIGEWDNAGGWFETALAIPGIETSMPVIASHAHLGKAKALIENTKYAQAIKHLGLSLQLCPGRSDSLYSMAVAQEMSGNRGAALKNLQEIINTPPRALQVSVDWSEAKIKAFLRMERLLVNKPHESSENAENALKQFPVRPEIHTMNGRVLLRKGKLMDALHAFEKSLTCARAGNIDAYIGLCCVYKKAGRQDAVESTLKSIGPEFADSPRYRALCRMTGRENVPPIGISDEKTRNELQWLKTMHGF